MSAVPTVPIWQAGQRVTASALQQLSDACTFAISPPVFVAAQTAAQSIATGSLIAITWPTPVIDSYSGWVGGSPTRYTPQVPGYYDIAATVSYATNATGDRLSVLEQNSAQVASSALTSGSASDSLGVPVCATLFFNGTTDFVELFAVQRSGGALNTTVAFTRMTARFSHA